MLSIPQDAHIIPIIPCNRRYCCRSMIIGGGKGLSPCCVHKNTHLWVNCGWNSPCCVFQHGYSTGNKGTEAAYYWTCPSYITSLAEKGHIEHVGTKWGRTTTRLFQSETQEAFLSSAFRRPPGSHSQKGRHMNLSMQFIVMTQCSCLTMGGIGKTRSLAEYLMP